MRRRCPKPQSNVHSAYRKLQRGEVWCVPIPFRVARAARVRIGVRHVLLLRLEPDRCWGVDALRPHPYMLRCFAIGEKNRQFARM